MAQRVASHFRRTVLVSAVIALGYWGLAQLSFKILSEAVPILPIWPPAGYSQALVLRLGWPGCPGIALGSLLLTMGAMPGAWLGWGLLAANNVLQPLVGAWLLRRHGFDRRLERLADVGNLLILGAMAPAALSATVGVTYRYWGGGLSGAELGPAWFGWWIGNVTGVLLLVPLLVTLSRWPQLLRRSMLALVPLWLGILGLVSWFVFYAQVRPMVAPYPLEYLPFPVVMWGALRLGPAGAAVGSAVVSVVAILGIAHGQSPFLSAAGSAAQGAGSLQAYVCVLALTAQMLAAVTQERQQAQRELEQEKEKSEELLLNILPQPIANRLKQQPGTIADHFAEVTVLFADIVNFTQLSNRLKPQELVLLLNEIFSSFDQLVETHGLEKIKTIGDAYMVVGGLPYYRPDHALAMAALALDMQRTTAQFSQRAGQPLRLRIGINTGPVVAGVIGTKKFIYDLWGDTVNLASRMESSGEAGQVQVSQSTYEALKGHYCLQLRGEVPIKGKGVMSTYWLLPPKESLSP